MLHYPQEYHQHQSQQQVDTTIDHFISLSQNTVVPPNTTTTENENNHNDVRDKVDTCIIANIDDDDCIRSKVSDSDEDYNSLQQEEGWIDV